MGGWSREPEKRDSSQLTHSGLRFGYGSTPLCKKHKRHMYIDKGSIVTWFVLWE